MGVVLWLSSGVVAFLGAKVAPVGRRRSWIAELAVALGVALALGLVATALDFGGWREPDWRAALFAFLGSFAGVGLLRLRS